MSTVSSRPEPGKCVWCGASLAEGKPLPGRIRCAACGVAMTAPWPSEEELDAAYAGSYRPRSGRFAGPGDAVLRRARELLAGRLDQVAPPGPVLDVGAGDGTLVDALAARGREALGLEREARPPLVQLRDISDVAGSWAAVVFWHSLEHLRAPAQALDSAIALLASGGVLIVAIPNAASLQARVFGRGWFALDLPRHLVHLPADALLHRLRQRGLRIERVSHLRGGQVLFGWLDGLVGMLPGNPDLYAAVRRPEARESQMTAPARAAALVAAAALVPVALVCAALEVGLRRGGSVYVEARRVEAPRA
jgi:SAM-dependent methyltransferase